MSHYSKLPVRKDQYWLNKDGADLIVGRVDTVRSPTDKNPEGTVTFIDHLKPTTIRRHGLGFGLVARNMVRIMKADADSIYKEYTRLSTSGLKPAEVMKNLRPFLQAVPTFEDRLAEKANKKNATQTQLPLPIPDAAEPKPDRATRYRKAIEALNEIIRLLEETASET